MVTSDSQILLAVAYGVNFWKIDKCTISVYHYIIFINIGLIVCCNFVLATAIIRGYWKAPIPALLRYIGIGIIFGFLGTILNEQKSRIYNPEYTPPHSRNDSAILLPASCFFNSEFQSVYSNSTVFTNIGHPMKPGQFHEWPFFIVNVIGLIAGFIRTVGQALIYTDAGEQRRTYQKRMAIFKYFYKVFAIAIFTSVCIYSWWRIFHLKGWVRHSGWIKPGRVQNPEDDWLSSGQLLPLISFATISVFVFNEFEFPLGPSSWKRPSQKPDTSQKSGIEMDSGTSHPPSSQREQ